MSWKADKEVYFEMREKVDKLKFYEFMTDKELIELLKADYQRHLDACEDSDHSEETDENILNHCHIKLARFWLIYYRLVRSETDHISRMFGLN